MHRLSAEGAINAFQWSKARLAKDLADGLLVVQRFEADSKFFRSFVVVLASLTLIYVRRSNGLAAVICFVAMIPALWRYIDQRFKATQQAYWFVITLEAMKAEPLTDAPRSDGLSHAGGVVYQGKGENLKYLLVQASNDRSQWVLPKGHIEPGENPRETAVREVREETGHWARAVRWLEDARLGNEANAPFVRWFLMELMELAEEAEVWPHENRQREWFALAEAKQKATFTETGALLDAATVYTNSQTPVKRHCMLLGLVKFLQRCR